MNPGLITTFLSLLSVCQTFEWIGEKSKKFFPFPFGREISENKDVKIKQAQQKWHILEPFWGERLWKRHERCLWAPRYVNGSDECARCNGAWCRTAVWRKKRSWWECALPADEEGNYIVTSTRCVRAHKITADRLARLPEIMLLISDQPASFVETTWRRTEQTLKSRSVLRADARQILSRTFSDGGVFDLRVERKITTYILRKRQLKSDLKLEVTRTLSAFEHDSYDTVVYSEAHTDAFSRKSASSVRISSMFSLIAQTVGWIFPPFHPLPSL